MGRVYRSQVSVEKVTETRFIIRAVPYPIHVAQVSGRVRARYGGTSYYTWTYRMLTMPDEPTRGPVTLKEALAGAAEWVGLETGETIKNRFAGVQRTAMGQGRCPYLGAVLCLGSPAPGSVWCEQHPNGRKVVME